MNVWYRSKSKKCIRRRHAARAERADGLVRDGGSLHVDAVQILLGGLAAFADRLGKRAGKAKD